jgi:hypothetical protein
MKYKLERKKFWIISKSAQRHNYDHDKIIRLLLLLEDKR